MAYLPLPRDTVDYTLYRARLSARPRLFLVMPLGVYPISVLAERAVMKISAAPRHSPMRWPVDAPLRMVGGFLVRWGWYVVLAIALTTLASSLVPDNAPPDRYQASLTVQIRLPPGTATTAQLNDTATVIAQIFTSPDMLSAALAHHPELKITALQQLVTATPVAGSNVILVSVLEVSPDAASSVALDLYQAVHDAISAQRSVVLQELDTTLTHELDSAQSAMSSTLVTLENLQAIGQTSSAQYRFLNNLYASERDRVTAVHTLLTTVGQLMTGSGDLFALGSPTPSISTVAGISPTRQQQDVLATLPQPAHSHFDPSELTRQQRLLLSPFIGLCMGIGGAALASRFSRRVPLTGERRQLNLPHVAAALPQARHLARGVAGESPDFAAPALQILRTLQYRASEHGLPLEVITITSADRGEGKSTVALALALAAARFGLRTVLVDANPLHPVLHDWLNVSPAPGTLDVIAALAAGRPADLALRQTSVEHLEVLPIGQSLTSSGDSREEALRVDGLRSMLRLLRARAGVVIVDGPPLLGDMGCAQLSALSDAVVLVADAKVGRRKRVIVAKDMLAALNAPCVLVVNRTRKEAVE